MNVYLDNLPKAFPYMTPISNDGLKKIMKVLNENIGRTSFAVTADGMGDMPHCLWMSQATYGLLKERLKYIDGVQL